MHNCGTFREHLFCSIYVGVVVAGRELEAKNMQTYRNKIENSAYTIS